jgi:hypothetical protein
MAWLWNSWEEFCDFVQPVSLSRGSFNAARRRSCFQNQQALFEAVTEIEAAMRELHCLGFDDADGRIRSMDTPALASAKGIVIALIRAGEEVLLYHKPLASGMAAYGFLHSHDLIEHWERYGSGRVPREIDQLLSDTQDLLAGYRESIEENEKFLVDDLHLPPELEVDFRVARDLFSVGFDDAGLLIAGRGLEGTLRKVAAKRRIQLQSKNKPRPLAEASFAVLIDGMAQVRWKRDSVRLLTPDTTALLHFLRNIRNGGAHPAEARKLATTPQDTARLIGQTATHLWEEIGNSRKALESTTVQLSQKGDTD